MKRGYIALYRKIQDHPFYKEKREFSKFEAWIDILMESQHSEKPIDILFDMTVITCNYGESLKSIKTWSKRWKWTESRVRRYFVLLEKMKQIRTKSAGKTTRLSVINYGIYDPKRRAIDEQSTSIRRAFDETSTTDNNDKNENNGNNVKKYTPEIENFVRSYQKYVSDSFGNLAPERTDSFLLKCCKTIEQLIRIDKFTFDDIFNSLQWASNDSFWRDQIKSLANVRAKGKNGEMKFKNMFTAYKKKDTQQLSSADKRLQSNIQAGEDFVNGF